MTRVLAVRSEIPYKTHVLACESKSRGVEMYILKLGHPLLVVICRDLAPLTSENKNGFPEL